MLIVKPFTELTLEQLYKILKLRYDVFVVEQKSIYDEFDEKDYHAIHIFYEDKKDIVAYTRLFKKSNKVAALGRVVVNTKFRKKGLGRKVVQEGIAYIKTVWKIKKIEIGAQVYLKSFYESFGFKQSSDVYDDCGVPHIDMVLFK
jgi:ElaA protein